MYSSCECGCDCKKCKKCQKPYCECECDYDPTLDAEDVEERDFDW